MRLCLFVRLSVAITSASTNVQSINRLFTLVSVETRPTHLRNHCRSMLRGNDYPVILCYFNLVLEPFCNKLPTRESTRCCIFRLSFLFYVEIVIITFIIISKCQTYASNLFIFFRITFIRHCIKRLRTEKILNFDFHFSKRFCQVKREKKKDDSSQDKKSRAFERHIQDRSVIYLTVINIPRGL